MQRPINLSQVLLISMQRGQGAAGLNLTMANHVVLLEPSTNAGVEAQAIGQWVGGVLLCMRMLCARVRPLASSAWLPFAARRRTAGRVHRLGQTKDVMVHRIVVEHTVEMAIREIARRRQAMCVGRLIMFL